VTEQILNAPPPIRRRSPYGSSAKRSPSAPSDLVYRYRWTLSAVGLLALSTLIVLWARTRPGYEPYGWLVWGHLAIHLQLDTNGAPSWKPLPFLFTLPYAVVGHYALWLWMITSVAISLAGVAFVCVEMYPHFYGWQVVPSHAQSAAQAARCRDLRLRT
jgi:hypothetical protein